MPHQGRDAQQDPQPGAPPDRDDDPPDRDAAAPVPGQVGVCRAPDCDRPVYAREHCGRHYKHLLRHGEVQPERPPARCAVPACERQAVTRGWCHGHYVRWNRTGDPQADVPLVRAQRDDCAYPGCLDGAHSAGWCRAHARRVRLYGDPDGGRPRRVSTGDGSLSHGYWMRAVPPSARHLVPGGRTKELEHRLVMAEVLGRPLLPEETVHHRNGDRLDNRPDNLELWSTAQPKGQRVTDKVSWATALLALYAPELLSQQALGQ